MIRLLAPLLLLGGLFLFVRSASLADTSTGEQQVTHEDNKAVAVAIMVAGFLAFLS